VLDLVCTSVQESRAVAGKPRNVAVKLIDTECAGNCLFRLILLVTADLFALTCLSNCTKICHKKNLKPCLEVIQWIIRTNRYLVYRQLIVIFALSSSVLEISQVLYADNPFFHIPCTPVLAEIRGCSLLSRSVTL